MTMADSDGPAKQQWSFAFLPSSYEEGVYDFRNSEDLYFIADQLCLTQNPRISEINFKYDSFDHEDDYAWLLVQELLQRFVRRSSSKSNLESIVLPPFSVNQSSPGLDIFSIMERIDEILDDDVFSGLQELHLYYNNQGYASDYYCD
ncbi:hypothetical protein MPER_12638 [Moniliophthora perniciosa FA553]|nr:hypothetical protein MPER_12638 [Moniliophthora perniciosa FA553]